MKLKRFQAFLIACPEFIEGRFAICAQSDTLEGLVGAAPDELGYGGVLDLESREWVGAGVLARINEEMAAAHEALHPRVHTCKTRAQHGMEVATVQALMFGSAGDFFSERPLTYRHFEQGLLRPPAA